MAILGFRIEYQPCEKCGLEVARLIEYKGKRLCELCYSQGIPKKRKNKKKRRFRGW